MTIYYCTSFGTIDDETYLVCILRRAGIPCTVVAIELLRDVLSPVVYYDSISRAGGGYSVDCDVVK